MIPSTYQEAMASPQAADWRNAMHEEMRSLMSNGTWQVESVPANAKVLPVKWVYTVKRGADGQILRFKARLVAKGFHQVTGVDYNEVYAPVSKHASLRALLAIAAQQDLEIHHLDVKTAFLNGELEETVYVKQPQGYVSGPPGSACRLLKSLYGLKQAPRAWYLKLKAELATKGFVPLDADPGIFVAFPPGKTPVYLGVWVDDLLTVCKSDALAHVKGDLSSLFDLRDLGPVESFLGMRITRDRAARTLTLDQTPLVTQLISEYGLSDGKPRSVPLDPGARFHPPQSESETLDPDVYPYAALVGSLLYISVCTRPDLARCCWRTGAPYGQTYHGALVCSQRCLALSLYHCQSGYHLRRKF